MPFPNLLGALGDVLAGRTAPEAPDRIASITSPVDAITLVAPSAAIPNVTLALGASTITIAPGQQKTLPYTVTRQHGARPVAMTALGLPAGLTAVFSANPSIGGVGTLTLIASPTMALGSTGASVRASGSNFPSKLAALNLIVASDAPDVPPDGITAFAGRFDVLDDMSVGAAPLTGCVWFAKGQCFPADLANAVLEINNVEVSSRIWPLAGRFSDGSLIGAGVKHTRVWGAVNTVVVATVKIGVTRTALSAGESADEVPHFKAGEEVVIRMKPTDKTKLEINSTFRSMVRDTVKILTPGTLIPFGTSVWEGTDPVHTVDAAVPNGVGRAWSVMVAENGPHLSQADHKDSTVPLYSAGYRDWYVDQPYNYVEYLMSISIVNNTGAPWVPGVDAWDKAGLSVYVSGSGNTPVDMNARTNLVNIFLACDKSHRVPRGLFTLTSINHLVETQAVRQRPGVRGITDAELTVRAPAYRGWMQAAMHLHRGQFVASFFTQANYGLDEFLMGRWAETGNAKLLFHALANANHQAAWSTSYDPAVAGYGRYGSVAYRDEMADYEGVAQMYWITASEAVRPVFMEILDQQLFKDLPESVLGFQRMLGDDLISLATTYGAYNGAAEGRPIARGGQMLALAVKMDAGQYTPSRVLRGRQTHSYQPPNWQPYGPFATITDVAKYYLNGMVTTGCRNPETTPWAFAPSRVTVEGTAITPELHGDYSIRGGGRFFNNAGVETSEGFWWQVKPFHHGLIDEALITGYDWVPLTAETRRHLKNALRAHSDMVWNHYWRGVEGTAYAGDERNMQWSIARPIDGGQPIDFTDANASHLTTTMLIATQAWHAHETGDLVTAARAQTMFTTAVNSGKADSNKFYWRGSYKLYLEAFRWMRRAFGLIPTLNETTP